MLHKVLSLSPLSLEMCRDTMTGHGERRQRGCGKKAGGVEQRDIYIHTWVYVYIYIVFVTEFAERYRMHLCGDTCVYPHKLP